MMESCFNDKVARTESIVVEDLRRDLNSVLTEMADAQDSSGVERELLQVYLRIRPFSQAELDSGESQDCVTIQPPDTVLLKAPRTSLSARLSDKSVPQTAQRFQFSQVFGPDTSQKDIFDGTVKSLVRDVLEGRNSLVFTYGVTNAGKTFTFLGPETDMGILPRSLNMIFSNLEGRIFTQMSLKPQRCQDVLKLTREQQVEEAISKRNLFRLLKENDAQKSMTSLLTSKTLEELAELEGSLSERSLSLDMDLHTKFSVWVSFCEIYNENIHDLLEQPPSNATRRTNLRLCQDIKGNSFIKDLRWVQVNSADEAFKVMKLGKRNQSISSTKLNQLSSRSHSIFSVRILRIEDVGIPRVHSVSELSLCDLAGSERCGKTQNKGDRLKEAGNINTSLLSLGKCINALKGNQQARHHVPFRESKLTHYLQGYFTGRGKSCMIVNINQCASMYDETLNVLKFSAVAQKVVVLTTATVLPLVVKRSAREVSFIINKASQRGSRRTSLLRWERSLEDVKEDTDSEEEEEEESIMEDTLQDSDDEGKETVLLDKEMYENQLMLLEELQEQLRTWKAENVALESRVRDEVTKEFSELFTQMQTDYNDRISKERELVEERCERRLEIFKSLVGKSAQDAYCDGGEEARKQESEPPSLDGMLDSMCCDLTGIRQDAEAAQSCLVTSDSQLSVAQSILEKKVIKLTEQLSETQKQLMLRSQELDSQSNLSKELEEMKKSLESREQRLTDLMVMCVEKDDLNAKIQAELDQAVEDAAKNRATIKELLQLKSNCTCSESRTKMETRKRRQDEGLQELHGQPPLKKGSLDDSSLPEDLSNDSLPEVRGQLKCYQLESHQKDEQIADLERERQTLEFCIRELKSQLEEEKQSRGDTLQEKERLAAELIALQKSMEEQQQKLLAMENQLSAAETNRSNLKASLETNCGARTTGSLGEEELNAVRCRLEEQDHDIKQKIALIESLEQELNQVKRETERFRDFSSCQECSRLRQEIGSKEETVKVLEQQLAEHKAAHDNLQRVNSDLQAEVASMNDLVTELKDQVRIRQVQQETEEEKKGREMAEKEAALLAKEEALKQKEAELFQREAELIGKDQLKEPESNAEKTDTELASRMAELAEKEAALVEKEVRLSALQKSLKEAQERLEEEETQAVQEARRREVERRREILAVAEEAIAQKDAELLKRQEEINSLKEEMKSNCEKVKSLSVDLQRREDDSADLREKLVDSKKQIQQVQKQISSMRDAEKTLKQKLSDLEKSKTQLQNEISNRDRSIQQLKSCSSDSKTEEHVQRYEKALKDLQARERVIEDMRLALTEQEETQTELDLELDNREAQIQELTQELENLKEIILKQRKKDSLPHNDTTVADDLTQAKKEAAHAQESLNLAAEKHQAERKKWLEEKLVLIAQAKEAEERRNQDMRRYADDRERRARQHTEMESLTAQLAEREEEMERWRKERDSLVSALEVQLKKLICSLAEKDKKIQELQCSDQSQTPEGADEGRAEELQALLNEKEAEIHRLNEQLSTLVHTHSTREAEASIHRDSSTQTVTMDDLEMGRPLDSSTVKLRRKTRGSVTSQGSCGSCPSVLDSSEVSTEMGRRSRFPRPEVEIAFSSLQPDRFALKRHGDESAVTVKISRKRKSGEMEKKRGSSRNSKTKPIPAPQASSQDGVEMENRRNLRCKNTPRLPAHQEEEVSPAQVAKKSHDSPSSLRGRKEGALQKIGGFLHSSPTFLGSKAKKIMGLMSGKSPDEGGSLSLKRHKRKLYRPNISSPMDIPAHQIISQDAEEKESDHLIIKKRLRTRTPK
ncbi:kinesin-like protein KIF20B isoform X1 [Pygocentrus nattereri]|uniref:kinesin-like protein KIF20B isoform X1 n=1 Tax=Pygocentrus nattereri TaxID=42514 RepID=UPI001890DD73|nr:kinesin-like protein KIF20B isoform X1 [Pygocentrus nattereri]